MTKQDFLKGVSGWDSHRPLLWAAINFFTKIHDPIIEFGSGEGSTPFLRKLCADIGVPFLTYDSNLEWAQKTGSVFIPDWRTADIYKPASVILVDNAPGELRHEIMAIMKDRAIFLVVHDTQEPGYMLDKVWPLFQFRRDYKEFNTEAAVVSNFVDVSSLKV